MRRVYALYPYLIYPHVFGSAIALAVGPLQLSTHFRRRWPKAQRVLGRVYLIAGVMVGGVAGLVLAFHSFGGWIAHLGFAVLAALWLLSGAVALRLALRRRLDLQRRWTILNFSLTFAAVTLRIQLGLAAAAGWPFEAFYPWLAWTSWVPNLLLAWVFARPQPPARQVRRHPDNGQ